MDCIVYEVAKSRTRLSDFHFSDNLETFLSSLPVVQSAAWIQSLLCSKTIKSSLLLMKQIVNPFS